MIRTAFWFFLVGVLVAVGLACLFWMVGYYSPTAYVVERIARVLWPTYIFLAVLDDKEVLTLKGGIVFLISFLANGLLYGVFGLMLRIAWNLVARRS